MKIDFSVALKQLNGEILCRIFEENGQKKKEKIDLKYVCVDALLTDYSNSQVWKKNAEQLSGKEKADRYCLAMRINQAKNSVDLKAEEISLLKKLIGIKYAPLIVGPVWQILEGGKNDGKSETCSG